MHMYTHYVKRGKNETFIKISISVSLAANTLKKNGFVYFIQSTGSIFCFLSHLHTNWEMLKQNFYLDLNHSIKIHHFVVVSVNVVK